MRRTKYLKQQKNQLFHNCRDKSQLGGWKMPENTNVLKEKIAKEIRVRAKELNEIRNRKQEYIFPEDYMEDLVRAEAEILKKYKL